MNDLRARLHRALPELAPDAVRLAFDDAGGGGGDARSRHLVLVSVRLGDASWVNLAVANRHGAEPEWTPLAVSTTVMVALVAGVALLLVRALTRPLRRLATAAKRLGVDVASEPLPVTGPEEVREAARAFNEMQARLRRLIDDRTQMMAAMSHDLKTPLTRLRLRSEYVEDGRERQRMLADLDDMEQMLNSTLAFLKGDRDHEPARLVDLASILESLCADHADLGHDVRYAGGAHATLRGRPLALKRAFANLIGNAVA